MAVHHRLVELGDASLGGLGVFRSGPRADYLHGVAAGVGQPEERLRETLVVTLERREPLVGLLSDGNRLRRHTRMYVYQYTSAFSLIGSPHPGVRRTFGFRLLVFATGVNLAVLECDIVRRLPPARGLRCRMDGDLTGTSTSDDAK